VLLGLYCGASQRVISVVMAVGAGVLISSAAFKLMEEAYREGHFDSPAIGLLVGALLCHRDEEGGWFGGVHTGLVWRRHGHLLAQRAAGVRVFLDGV
jgi:hypothetical protein